MLATAAQEKVKEQHGFLKRSVASFLEGHSAEALRIATAIRVLVHETGRSKPLLKQLTQNYLEITILGHPPPAPTRLGNFILLYIGLGFRMSSDKGLQPLTDLSEPNLQMMPLGSWWNECILIFPGPNNARIVFARKNLLLTLANKEGGAHVDPNLPPEYEKYIVNAPMTFTVNGVQTDTADYARYAAVQSAVQMVECLERNFPWTAKESG